MNNILNNKTNKVKDKEFLNENGYRKNAAYKIIVE